MYISYGEMLVSIGEPQNALFYLKEAISIVSQNTLKSSTESQSNSLPSISQTAVNITKSWMALALDKVNKVEEAKAVYEEVMREEGDCNMALGNFAIFCHRKLKDFDRAEDLFERHISTYPTDSSILLKFAAFMKSGRRNYSRAGDLYEKAIESDANSETLVR